MRSEGASRSAARVIALVYLALAIPAVLLFVITAIVRADPGLFVAALALVVASLLAGGISALLVLELTPADRAGISAIGIWLIVLGVPIWGVTMVGTSLTATWLHSRALADLLSLATTDSFVIAVGLAIFVSAALLGFEAAIDAKTPTVVRHRRALITNRTMVAFMFLIFTTGLSLAATGRARRAYGSAPVLATQIPALTREAERYPNDFRSQYVLGNALDRVRDCSHALAPLQRAVALEPRNGWAHNDLGFALSCLGRYSDGVPEYLASVNLMPNELQARLGLAWALEQSRDSTAEQQYREIRTRWPNEAFAMAREATLRYDRGHRDDGLQEMRAALAIDDTSYWVRLAAAQLFSSAALLPDALAQYRRLATRDSSNLWIWAHYGSAAYLAGELNEARRAFDHADSVHPHGLESVSAWRDMWDAARRGVPPSELPPIQPRALPSRF